jgi:kinesin family protein 18/19
MRNQVLDHDIMDPAPGERRNRFNDDYFGGNAKRSKSSNLNPRSQRKLASAKKVENLYASAFEVTGNKLSANTGKNYLEYSFDQIYQEEVGNQEIYYDILKGDMKKILKGKWLTMMTYGTSGSGKTHTIFGDSIGKERGLVYFASDQLFKLFKKKKISFEMTCCLLEIYNENITNLLPFNKSRVDLLEDEYGEIILQHAQRVEVQSSDELKKIVEAGAQSRHIAENFSNKRSSRSHMIVLLEISFHYKGELRHTKVAFLDLAGSERMVLDKKELMREGANINRSLLALTNCISILAEKNSKKHVPYRDSKLTRILKDFMAHENIIKFLVCLKQEKRFLEESLITLNYAYRAQKIEKSKNLVKFQVNSVKYYKHKITQLEKELKLLKKNKHPVHSSMVGRLKLVF